MASYFIQMGQLLSGANADSKQQNDKEMLKEICATLGLSEGNLKSCKHPNDITKTCREIVRKIYPNKSERAKQSVTVMARRESQLFVVSVR